MIRLQFLQRALLKKLSPSVQILYRQSIRQYAIQESTKLSDTSTDSTYKPRPGSGLICTCRLSTNQPHTMQSKIFQNFLVFLLIFFNRAIIKDKKKGPGVDVNSMGWSAAPWISCLRKNVRVPNSPTGTDLFILSMLKFDTCNSNMFVSESSTGCRPSLA